MTTTIAAIEAPITAEEIELGVAVGVAVAKGKNDENVLLYAHLKECHLEIPVKNECISNEKREYTWCPKNNNATFDI